MSDKNHPGGKGEETSTLSSESTTESDRKKRKRKRKNRNAVVPVHAATVVTGDNGAKWKVVIVTSWIAPLC